MRGWPEKNILSSFFTGMTAGIIGGVMGIGGGVVLVPLLIKFFKIEQHKAHGTSLTIVFFIALSGAILYILRGDINWLLVAEIAAGSICGAVIGARLMLKIPRKRLRLGFGFFALFLALWMFLKPLLLGG